MFEIDGNLKDLLSIDRETGNKVVSSSDFQFNNGVLFNLIILFLLWEKA